MSVPANRLLVLLVEDSDDDAFFFRWMLKKCDVACDVVHVFDGAAAIQFLQNSQARQEGARTPDLVFLDLRMPGFNGFEVLSWIRDHPFDPPLNVTVISSSEQNRDIQRAKALGVSAYDVKPLALDQLRLRLAACDRRPAVAVASTQEPAQGHSATMGSI